MLDQYVKQGSDAALVHFGLKQAEGLPLPSAGGMMSGARGFLGNQWGAAKDLFANLRGGLGGKFNPDVMPNANPALARQAHRARAVQNIGTLAPTLLAGGALYMMHRHNQAKRDAEARQQAMMGGGMGGMGGTGGYPAM